MVFRRIEAALGLSVRHEIKVGSASPIYIKPYHLERIMFRPIELGLQFAKEDEITPLNFRRIKEQVSDDMIQDAVLFDSSYTIAGNHWRILELNEKGPVIQLCGPIGTYDEDFPPLNISHDDVIFTGIAVQNFTYYGHPIPLNNAYALIKNAGMRRPPELIHESQTIFFSKNGDLQVHVRG